MSEYKRIGRKVYQRKGKSRNFALMQTFPSQKKARRKITNLRMKEYGMYGPTGRGLVMEIPVVRLNLWQSLMKKIVQMIDRFKSGKPESRAPRDRVNSPRFGGFKRRFLSKVSSRQHEKQPPKTRGNL